MAGTVRLWVHWHSPGACRASLSKANNCEGVGKLESSSLQSAPSRLLNGLVWETLGRPEGNILPGRPAPGMARHTDTDSDSDGEIFATLGMICIGVNKHTRLAEMYLLYYANKMLKWHEWHSLHQCCTFIQMMTSSQYKTHFISYLLHASFIKFGTSRKDK